MERKDKSARRGFRSRASLAKSKNQNLSYKERLALASKGKESCRADIGTADDAGYILVR